MSCMYRLYRPGPAQRGRPKQTAGILCAQNCNNLRSEPPRAVCLRGAISSLGQVPCTSARTLQVAPPAKPAATEIPSSKQGMLTSLPTCQSQRQVQPHKCRLLSSASIKMENICCVTPAAAEEITNCGRLSCVASPGIGYRLNQVTARRTHPGRHTLRSLRSRPLQLERPWSRRNSQSNMPPGRRFHHMPLSSQSSCRSGGARGQSRFHS